MSKSKKSDFNRTLESLQRAGARKGVHPKTIRRRIASGELTGYKLGDRLVRVDAAEVDRLFKLIPTAKSD